MKKQLSILLAGALAFTLAGCAANAEPVTVIETGTTDTAVAEAASYSLADAVTFTFTDDGITASADSSSYKIDGCSLTIKESGTYVLSGSCADGSIKVKAGGSGVTLILNGLDLTSADTAPIVCGKSSVVTIVAAEGTANTLTDSAANNADDNPDNDNAENAVLKCKDGSQVTLCGTGSLTLNANGKNGIKSGAANTDEDGTTQDASLTIRELTLTINAPVNDAVNAGQALNVESGTLTIAAGDDALHCDLVLNIGAEGTAGPDITITGCYEGLEGAAINVYSGTIDITATDDCLNAANPDLTDYDYAMNIYGGTITAYSTSGDGFDSNGSMTFTGGTVAVWTANTADNEPLDADGTITVTGGTILAAGGSSGMGMTIDAQQAYVTFGESAGMGGMGGPGGRPGEESEASTEAGTDSAESTALSLAAGDSFTLVNAAGETVYSGTAVCATRYLFYSSADLGDGESYSIGSIAATAQTGTATTGMAGGPGGMGGEMGGEMGGPGGDRDADFDPANAPTDGQRPNDDREPPEKPE